MSEFEELIKGLSPLCNTSLQVDGKGCCQLLINQAFHIQLSLDRPRENLLIATLLGEIPPGKFRENTLKNALKENHPFPQDGILSYSERQNQLCLFTLIPLHETSSQKLYDFLKIFSAKADRWRKNLKSS